MLFCTFLLVDQKRFFYQSEHCDLLFLQSEENIVCELLDNIIFNDKKESMFTPWKR